MLVTVDLNVYVAKQLETFNALKTGTSDCIFIRHIIFGNLKL
jgi:hypothetical protein